MAVTALRGPGRGEAGERASREGAGECGERDRVPRRPPPFGAGRGQAGRRVAGATITNPLFALSVELRPKDSSSIPTCAPLLPALLVSLLQSLVIRPILRFVHRSIGLLVLKLQESSCPFVVRPSELLPPLHSGPAGWLQQALGKVAAEVGRILLSEQTSLWGLYLLAPHLFDVKFELNVEIGMLRAMLCLLLTSMGRLLMTGGLGAVMDQYGLRHA
ncbi:hypothetical protein BS78_07G055300 [Paspalum vaginatum]|nr:hypothetical protein BS78_07G055300 [Paspalum vaginatum]